MGRRWDWSEGSGMWFECLASAKGENTQAFLHGCPDVGQRERRRSEN